MLSSPPMVDVTLKHLDEMDAYEGPHAIEGVVLRRAAASLSLTAWGMNVLQLAPNSDGHPEHAHHEDGQEEVYALLSGSATLLADGERLALRTGSFARVGPGVTRKIIAGPEGATVLAIGGTPGQAYRSQYAM